MGVLQTLLKDRGLDAPDGRPLYQYRMTETEFQDLTALLKTISSLSKDLNEISRLGTFAESFVLYAAEWWRRYYDGSGFSWEPILTSVDANASGWSQAARSACIQRGFQWWGLELLNSRGLRFLGSVALQGGLPLSLLASAQGKIGQMLKRVLQLARSEHVTQNALEGWVESLQHHLPQTYRRPEIVALLADMAWSTLQLSREAGLSSAHESIAILDRRIPQWRQRFPLPMEDQHAQGLLEQLIKEASAVRTAAPRAFLPLERYLEQGDDEWIVHSQLLLPEELPVTQIHACFGIDNQSLTRAIDIGLTIGEKAQSLTFRKMADRESYRGTRAVWGCDGSLAAREHVLTLATPDGRHFNTQVPKGGELDLNLPWVFSDSNGQYRFIRQGGGNLAAADALVLLPSVWTIVDSSGKHAILGRTTNPSAMVVKVSEELRATSHDGLEFRLRLGRADEQDETLELIGNRSWHAFTSPTQVFLGKPDLYRCAADGRRIGKVEGGWTTPRTTLVGFRIGPLQMRYPASGDIRYRSRVLVLPPDAELAAEFKESRAGALRFKRWGLASARVLTTGIQQGFAQEGKDLLLNVQGAPGMPLPVSLQLELHWAHTSDPVHLTVPFPVQGVRAFNGSGVELRSGSSIAVQHLAGVRLRVALGLTHLRCKLELELGGKARQKNVRQFALQSQAGALQLELRLIDYIDDIQQLFSADDTTDAQVYVTCKIGNQDGFRLSLTRYAGHIAREGDLIMLAHQALVDLSPDALLNIPLCALRLEAPAEEALVLEPLRSENVASGSWDFTPALSESGSWLVYPGPSSSLPFRPTLCPVAGPAEASSKLTQAFAIPSGERFAAIDAVLATMAADYTVPDWQDVEQLITQIGHLPLPTLDLWKRFAHSPDAMAALALRFGKLPAGFLDRFANELSFAWELVPFSCWLDGIQKLKQQCEREYANTAGVIFEQHLNNQIDRLSASSGALAYSLGIASSSFINKFQKNTKAIKEGVGKYLFEQICKGPESDCMKLRQIHADDTWPQELYAYVREHEQAAPFCNYLVNDLHPTQHSVVNLPIFLALQVARGTSRSWFDAPDDIHPLRKYLAFDRDWFVSAFNHTLARAVNERLIPQLNTSND